MSKVNNIIFINDSDNKIGLSCKICDYLLCSIQDIESSREWNCCMECFMTFAESRLQEWKNGWRPDEETLNSYKQSRKIINTDIIKILGE